MSTSVLAPDSPELGPFAELRPFDFALPDALAAREPPEARGLARDGVRLLVSRVAGDVVTHERFVDLPDLVGPGAVLVVNASATVNAALDAWREGTHESAGERIVLHLSSPLPGAGTGDGDRGGRWVVELRRVTADGTAPLLTARPGERIRLPGGVTAVIAEPFVPRAGHAPPGGRVRLWIAAVAFPGGALRYLAAHGSPIRYKYLSAPRPLADYQTIFAAEPGSAEMPSAGRPFTREIVERLERKGVGVARVMLHTGVASLEYDELPYPERYRVPAEAAEAVNRARAAGRQVIAVGTTAVRALETVASASGRVRAGEGWTDLAVTSGRGLHAIDGILTGFHEPRSSHLAMLEVLAGRRHLVVAYEAALRNRYLWHEFGDLHLMLGGDARGT